MKARAIAAITLVWGIGVRAEDTASLPVDDPLVIAAMKRAWRQSVNGRAGTEAAFRLDGSLSGYKIVAAAFTNQLMKQRLMIAPGRTFAVFHVHPVAGEAAPSPRDRELADRYKLKVVTIHAKGLFEYDPVKGKTVKIRDGLQWLHSPSGCERARCSEAILRPIWKNSSAE